MRILFLIYLTLGCSVFVVLGLGGTGSINSYVPNYYGGGVGGGMGYPYGVGGGGYPYGGGYGYGNFGQGGYGGLGGVGGRGGLRGLGLIAMIIIGFIALMFMCKLENNIV